MHKRAVEMNSGVTQTQNRQGISAGCPEALIYIDLLIKALCSAAIQGGELEHLGWSKSSN